MGNICKIYNDILTNCFYQLILKSGVKNVKEQNVKGQFTRRGFFFPFKMAKIVKDADIQHWQSFVGMGILLI